MTCGKSPQPKNPHLTLYRWTKFVTYTVSSVLAVGYAYFEGHREYPALLSCRLRQKDLNPRRTASGEQPRVEGELLRLADSDSLEGGMGRIEQVVKFSRNDDARQREDR